MEQLLTYGLCDNELKHISEVENGLGCNCICSNCKHPLVAKNNPINKKARHFAHYSGRECDGAIETALHLLAKSILFKTKRLKTPKYHFDYNPNNKKSVFRESCDLIFDSVKLEVPINLNGKIIKPDAVCEIQNKQIFIEFAKTHFIKESKKSQLRQLGAACIEINLNGEILDEVSLTKFLNSDTPLKYWIVNKRLDEEFAKVQEKQIAEQRMLANQKENENAKRKIENELKVKRYKGNSQYRVLKASNLGLIENCPLNQSEFTILINSHFCQHPILKNIINGEHWNGKIYGDPPNGKYIFVGKEKVIVFPHNLQCEIESDKESKMSRLLYRGLKTINEIRSNPCMSKCTKCIHHFDDFNDEGKNFVVCGHP